VNNKEGVMVYDERVGVESRNAICPKMESISHAPEIVYWCGPCTKSREYAVSFTHFLLFRYILDILIHSITIGYEYRKAAEHEY
jgi:hypothetical protein